MRRNFIGLLKFLDKIACTIKSHLHGYLRHRCIGMCQKVLRLLHTEVIDVFHQGFSRILAEKLHKIILTVIGKSGTIARISTMRKLAHALNVSYDYLKHDEITDPSYGIEKMDYIDEVNGQLGEKGARDINEILEANRALFAGGELDEEAKDAFYQAVTKAYLSCKMEAKKTFGRKKKNTEMESDS